MVHLAEARHELFRHLMEHRALTLKAWENTE